MEHRPEFLKEELERYSRHIIIPEFNIEGQRRLKAAKVLVVGIGGLGSPLLLYLAAAGIGTLGIVDFDRVEASNLQRQVLFDMDDLGKPKALAAKERLEKLNPYIRINTYDEALTSENALDILSNYDIVADGTDNFPTRYLVNDACVILGLPNVYGSIYRFEGQVSVFNHRDPSGERGPNYRDLFPTPPPPGLVPSCAEGGVIGVLPGIIGSLQASEVIKIASGVGKPLSGRLFLLDAQTFETRTLTVHKHPDRPEITELIDYQEFCGIPAEEGVTVSDPNIREIGPEILRQWIASDENLQLIDVRESFEYEIANLGGELLPLQNLASHSERIQREGKVVIHCRSGKRSADAIRMLQDQFGFSNLYNLQGGILAYADRVDPALAKY